VVVAFQLSGILAALALGFMLGRIWEMRREIGRELSDHVGNVARAPSLSQNLRALCLSLRARVQTDRGGLVRTSDQVRVDPVMTTAEREAREIATLMATGTNVMEAIRAIKERRVA
jgi:hypothetical protein